MKLVNVLLSSTLLASPLMAAAVGPAEGDKSFTISGSGNSDKDFDNSAFGVSAELGYYLTDGLQVGLRQSANGINNEEADDEWAGSTRGFVNYNFLDGHFRPFIGVNLGGVYGESVSNTGTAGAEAGVKLYVLEKTYINLGVEYSFFFEDSDDVNNSVDDGAYFYNIGVGFNW